MAGKPNNAPFAVVATIALVVCATVSASFGQAPFAPSASQAPPQSPLPQSTSPQPTSSPSGVAPAVFNDVQARPISAAETATSPPVVPPTARRETIPLSRPDARPIERLSPDGTGADSAARPKSGSSTGFVGVLGALGVVLGLFFLFAAFLRRGTNKTVRLLPGEAVEILGRIPFPGRQHGHLIRVGNKITLVSFSNLGAEPLVEITDPLEVDRLAGLCRRQDPQSSTNSFRSIVEQFFHDKSSASSAARNAEADDV